MPTIDNRATVGDISGLCISADSEVEGDAADFILAYVLAPAQGGYHLNGRETHGDSMIVDPWGVVLAQAPDSETYVTADMNLEDLHRIREQLLNSLACKLRMLLDCAIKLIHISLMMFPMVNFHGCFVNMWF